MSDNPPKMLKFTVFSLGIVIIGGFLWVGAVIVQRLTSGQATKAPARCEQVTLPILPERAESVTIRATAAGWVVTFQKDGEYKALRFDECGTQMQQLKVESLPETLPAL